MQKSSEANYYKMKAVQYICRLALRSFMNLNDVPLGRNSLEKNMLSLG